MSIGIDDFRCSQFFNDDKSLKKDILIYYESKPYWHEIPRSITVLVYQDYSFEIKIVWYKFPVNHRLYSIYKSDLLPNNILKLIKKLQSFEKIELQSLYCSKEEDYSPEGISVDYYYFNLQNETTYINMSSYWTDEKLFKSKEEKHVLKFHKEMKDWKESVYTKIIAIHD